MDNFRDPSFQYFFDSDDSEASTIRDNSSSDYEPDEEISSSEQSEIDDDVSNVLPSASGTSWSNTIRSPPNQLFLSRQGPTSLAAVADLESPIDYFGLFFDEDLLEHILVQTNLYAEQYFENQTVSDSSRFKSWVPINDEEFKTFIGLLLLTGLVNKRGRLADYWSRDPIVATPFFNACMARNRFQIIYSFLHFNDNKTMPQNGVDKLFKIRPVYDKLIEKFKALYNMGENITIDEAMLNWRGRLGFKVFMKNKPVKHGIKSYVLADSQSSYCWNLSIYKKDPKSLSDTVTDLLTSKCYNVWHTLYMDDFYNSVSLSELLLSKKIRTIGTLRSNRGESPELRKVGNMQRHDVKAYDNGKVCVMAWKDKRIVKAITTKHDDSVCPISRIIRGAHGQTETVSKPCAIVDYNKNMSGVDKLDQMVSYYPCTRKTFKWTNKVFCYLMEISLYNSFVIYNAKSVRRSYKTVA